MQNKGRFTLIIRIPSVVVIVLKGGKERGCIGKSRGLESESEASFLSNTFN